MSELKSLDKLRDCTWIGGGKVNEYLDEIQAETPTLTGIRRRGASRDSIGRGRGARRSRV